MRSSIDKVQLGSLIEKEDDSIELNCLTEQDSSTSVVIDCIDEDSEQSLREASSLRNATFTRNYFENKQLSFFGADKLIQSHNFEKPLPTIAESTFVNVEPNEKLMNVAEALLTSYKELLKKIHHKELLTPELHENLAFFTNDRSPFGSPRPQKNSFLECVENENSHLRRDYELLEKEIEGLTNENLRLHEENEILTRQAEYFDKQFCDQEQDFKKSRSTFEALLDQKDTELKQLSDQLNETLRERLVL